MYSLSCGDRKVPKLYGVERSGAECSRSICLASLSLFPLVLCVLSLWFFTLLFGGGSVVWREVLVNYVWLVSSASVESLRFSPSVFFAKLTRLL